MVFGPISTGTTVESNLSLTGQLFASNISSVGTIIAPQVWASQFSGSNLSSGGTLQGNAIWASSISVGGFTQPTISSTSSLVAAFVVQGSASSFTVVTWAAAKVGDVISVGVFGGAAASSISSGLVPHSHVTQAGQIEFRLSNASTLVQNQSSQSWVFIRLSPNP